MMNKGNLYVFTGPSGTGKGTILKQKKSLSITERVETVSTGRTISPDAT